MTLRRDFLAFTAGAVAARTVVPIAANAETQASSVHPDAELLAACGEFDRLELASNATFQDEEAGSAEEEAAEAERERLDEAQQPLLDRICELRAITREGQAARARTLALWDADLMKGESPYTIDRLMVAIVRDLIDEVPR